MYTDCICFFSGVDVAPVDTERKSTHPNTQKVFEEETTQRQCCYWQISTDAAAANVQFKTYWIAPTIQTYFKHNWARNSFLIHICKEVEDIFQHWYDWHPELKRRARRDESMEFHGIKSELCWKKVQRDSKKKSPDFDYFAPTNSRIFPFYCPQYFLSIISWIIWISGEKKKSSLWLNSGKYKSSRANC